MNRLPIHKNWTGCLGPGCLLALVICAVASHKSVAQEPAAEPSAKTTPASAVTRPADDSKWQAVSPEGSRVAVLMPGDPQITSATIRPLPEKEVTVHIITTPYKDGQALFLLGYHDLDFTPQDEKKINDVLIGGVKGTVLNVLGKVTKLEPIAWESYPGRHFEYAGKRFGQQVRGVSRMYLAGARIYQLTVLSTPSIDVETETKKFFDSLKILDSPTQTESPPAGSAAKSPSGSD